MQSNSGACFLSRHAIAHTHCQRTDIMSRRRSGRQCIDHSEFPCNGHFMQIVIVIIRGATPLAGTSFQWSSDSPAHLTICHGCLLEYAQYMQGGAHTQRERRESKKEGAYRCWRIHYFKISSVMSILIIVIIPHHRPSPPLSPRLFMLFVLVPHFPIIQIFTPFLLRPDLSLPA